MIFLYKYWCRIYLRIRANTRAPGVLIMNPWRAFQATKNVFSHLRRLKKLNNYVFLVRWTQFYKKILLCRNFKFGIHITKAWPCGMWILFQKNLFFPFPFTFNSFLFKINPAFEDEMKNTKIKFKEAVCSSISTFVSSFLLYL